MNLNFIPQILQNLAGTYLVELEVDRLVDDTVGAFTDLLEELEAWATEFLLSVELLLRLGGFPRLLGHFDAFADVGVGVDLHGSVLALLRDTGGGLANQAHVFLEFCFRLSLLHFC